MAINNIPPGDRYQRDKLAKMRTLDNKATGVEGGWFVDHYPSSAAHSELDMLGKMGSGLNRTWAVLKAWNRDQRE